MEVYLFSKNWHRCSSYFSSFLKYSISRNSLCLNKNKQFESDHNTLWNEENRGINERESEKIKQKYAKIEWMRSGCRQHRFSNDTADYSEKKVRLVVIEFNSSAVDLFISSCKQATRSGAKKKHTTPFYLGNIGKRSARQVAWSWNTKWLFIASTFARSFYVELFSL